MSTVSYSQRVSASAARELQYAKLKRRKVSLGIQNRYDATDAGKLELRRRIAQEHNDSFREKLERRLARAEGTVLSVSRKGLLTHEDKKRASQVLTEASESADWGGIERRSKEDVRIGGALIDKSAEWMESMTAEEVEVVSWLTSNGSHVLNDHAKGRENCIWGHSTYSPEHLDRQVELLNSAVSKAPELNEPVTIYRGVNIENASQLFPVGEEVRDEVPKSYTLSPKTAQNFTHYGDEVVLKLSTKKLASPAAVSAWGSGEYEVFSDPLTAYEVVSVSKKPGRYGGELSVVELRKKPD